MKTFYWIATAVLVYFIVGAFFDSEFLPFGDYFFKCPFGSPCTFRVYAIMPVVGFLCIPALLILNAVAGPYVFASVNWKRAASVFLALATAGILITGVVLLREAAESRLSAEQFRASLPR